MYLPIRWENDLPVFTTEQVDVFGEPDETKYPRYMVIEGPPIYQTGFVEQQQTFLKKIHRYDRRARFRLQLQKILGCSPISKKRVDHIIPIIQTYVPDDAADSYDRLHKILGAYKQTKLIPYIPTLLRMAKKKAPIDVECPSEMLELLMDDFKFFEINYFNAIDIRKDRKYMLNMRYLAYKLLQRRGVKINFPLLRTKRRIQLLDDIFDKVVKQ